MTSRYIPTALEKFGGLQDHGSMRLWFGNRGDGNLGF